MSEERIAALEANLRAVTDQVGSLLDRVLQKGFVPVFRCSHSGLLYPADFVREWGRKYGIGLGMSPVSEALDTEYDVPPPEITSELTSIEQIMHPVRVSSAQVDLAMVPPEEWEQFAAIVAHEDRSMRRRVQKVLVKQVANSTRVRLLRMKYKEVIQ